MSYKSDVKPVVLTTDGVGFTGRTRLRGLMVQSTGSSGSAIINTLDATGATTAASTTTGVYLKVQVGAGGTETLKIFQKMVFCMQTVLAQQPFPM